jgi:hypothetical protein
MQLDDLWPRRDFVVPDCWLAGYNALRLVFTTVGPTARMRQIDKYDELPIFGHFPSIAGHFFPFREPEHSAAHERYFKLRNLPSRFVYSRFCVVVRVVSQVSFCSLWPVPFGQSRHPVKILDAVFCVFPIARSRSRPLFLSFWGTPRFGGPCWAEVSAPQEEALRKIALNYYSISWKCTQGFPFFGEYAPIGRLTSFAAATSRGLPKSGEIGLGNLPRASPNNNDRYIGVQRHPGARLNPAYT